MEVCGGALVVAVDWNREGVAGAWVFAAGVEAEGAGLGDRRGCELVVTARC